MNVIHRPAVIVASLALAVPLWPATGADDQAPPNTVIEVRVEGNKHLTDTAVLANVKLREGQPYDEKLLREDEQRLLKTRRFDRIDAVKTQTDKGVIVTFRVVERPVVEAVRFEGNKAFKEKDLASAIALGVGDPIDPYLVNSAIRAIESTYRSGGYVEVSVKYDATALKTKRHVVFRIREGHKVSLKSIRFKGNEALSSFRLKRVINSRARIWLLTAGALDMETAERDVVDLRNFYHSEGYLDAQVSRDLAFSPDKRTVVLTFIIEEGSRFRIRKVTFEGNKVHPDEQIRGHLKLVAGSSYHALALRRDLDEIRALYGEIGYVDTDVRVKPIHAAEVGLVDLAYTIEEGRQFRVGRIDIRGNDVTKMNVIRRQLQFRPGQVYNTVAATESRRRLLETQLFEKVEITPYGEAADERNSLVTIKEGQTGQFIIGAGVSSNTGLLGTVSYTERNFDLLAWPKSRKDWRRKRAFRGAGQTLRVVAEPGTEFMRFRIDWREPYLFDKPYSLGTRVFAFTSGRETYDETRYGGIVSVGHLFPNRWYGELAGRIEGVRINRLDDDKAPRDVRDVEGTSTLGGVKGTIIRDRTDSRWLPASGDRLSINYEQVTGDFNFGKAGADYHLYHTVFMDEMDRKHILAFRAAAGSVFGDAPVFERFYGGGLGSIRGFKYRGISPRQGRHREPVGGEFMTLLGVEYSFPLVARQLRGVIFIDSGTVEREIEIRDYRASGGFGVRLQMPLFGRVPMTLDLGFPLNKTDDDDTRVVSFSVGWVF